MGTVILCSGVYAKTPYLIEEDKICLFSVEELCYYLYKNAFLLQDDFFSEKLFSWLEEECQLKEWGTELRQLKENSAPLFDFIAYLFRKTGFFAEEDLAKVEKVLNDSNHLSVPEKRKIRADAYFKKGRIAIAMQEYEMLLKDTAYEDRKFRARLYHNLGVCNAMLFQYKKAAEELKLAYRCYPNTETYVQFLCALKLSCSREEYLSYLSEHKESYEDSLEVERRVNMVQKEWTDSENGKKFPFEEEQEQGNYYETIEKLTRQAKEDYLYMINQG